MEGSENSWYMPRDRISGFNVRRAIRAFPQVAKATCPHCQTEVNLSGFRQHVALCRLEQYEAPEDSELTFDQARLSSDSSASRERSDLSPPQEDVESRDSDSYENIGSDHLTIRSQFVSVNQSIDSQFATSLPLELPKKAPSRLSASRPPSGKKIMLSCPICFSDYDRKEHVPLVLPACGHTMCDHCMRHIYNSSSTAKCPVCRSTNYERVRSLPINHALLELNEEQQSAQLCKAHDKEVLAYCKDHELLLCGMCAFEHKDHLSFPLTSEEAAELVQQNREKLSEIERRLTDLHSEWSKVSKDQNSVIVSTRQSLEFHSKGLQAAAEEAVTLLHNGRTACSNELKTLYRESGVQDIQNQCATQLQKVGQDLQTLKERRSCFDQLSIAEKLATALSFRAENYEKPPSLAKLRELEAKMKAEVDYEIAIRSSALFSL